MSHGKQVAPQKIAADTRELDFVPWIGRTFSGSTRGAYWKYFAAHRVCQIFDLEFAEASFDFDPIDLWQVSRRLQHAVGKITVAREENDAAGGVVQSAYRK